MTELGSDWRVLDGVTTAWFDAPSLIEGASLAARAVELSPGIAVDVRATGVRVRLDVDAHAATVSASARTLGLVANPTVLQQVGVVIETDNPTAVTDFWQRVLDYVPTEGGPVDPLQRDPAIAVRPSPEQRTLRNRIHLDVVRPTAAVEQLGLGEGFGAYGVCHTDPDGNEVDLVPADAHGLDVDFTELARRIQAAARDLGAVADAGLPRFAQLFIDAADVDAVRDFWVAALGYVRDRRDGCTDIVDPRRLNPVLLFQELDTSDTARRQQRNRIHFELAVPADQAAARVATTVAAGGQLLGESPGRWLIADPEGNELAILTET